MVDRAVLHVEALSTLPPSDYISLDIDLVRRLYGYRYSTCVTTAVCGVGSRDSPDI